MKKKFMLLALIALGGMSAFAEESPVLELKQTVVTSDSFGTPIRETAKNMTVINAKEIKEKGAKTIADALKGVPGVVVRQMDGTSPTIDLRGSGATAQFNTVILLDGGVPLPIGLLLSGPASVSGRGHAIREGFFNDGREQGRLSVRQGRPPAPGGRDQGELPELRHERHRGAGAARCPRRPEARAAARPVRHVGAGASAQLGVQEVRPRRRRDHGQVPPP